MSDKYLFQYCQKIVVFSKDLKKVLLCKRSSEADLDGIFSFIGGKMEVTDATMIDGMQREKNEEIGREAKIKLYPTFSTNVRFVKKDGNIMILPHYFSILIEGRIALNEEYSEYKWVNISELESFEPKVEGITQIVEALKRLIPLIEEEEYIII
jgi:8-oxo-dGTP pyrophosphatase MutT (NUDIX family)